MQAVVSIIQNGEKAQEGEVGGGEGGPQAEQDSSSSSSSGGEMESFHASLCHRPPLPLSPDSGSASEGEESGQEEGGGATTPPSPQQPPPQAGSQPPNTRDLFGGESSSYVPLSNNYND